MKGYISISEAAPTAIAAFVSLGSYEGYHRMKKELDRLAQEKKGKVEGILAEFALDSTAISMSVPEMVLEWFKNGGFRFVSPKFKDVRPLFIKQIFLCHWTRCCRIFCGKYRLDFLQSTNI